MVYPVSLNTIARTIVFISLKDRSRNRERKDRKKRKETERKEKEEMKLKGIRSTGII